MRGAKALLLAEHRDGRLDALVDVEPGHLSAKPTQLADVVLVPSVDVVDMADACLAFGDDAGEHQGGSRAKVSRFYRRALQKLDPTDESMMILDGDVGAHARELGGEHETVLENVLRDD